MIVRRIDHRQPVSGPVVGHTGIGCAGGAGLRWRWLSSLTGLDRPAQYHVRQLATVLAGTQSGG